MKRSSVLPPAAFSCLDALRKELNEIRRLLDTLEEAEKYSAAPILQQAIESQRERERITIDAIADAILPAFAVLDRIPFRYRTLFMIRYISGYSWQRAAEKVGVTYDHAMYLKRKVFMELEREGEQQQGNFRE